MGSSSIGFMISIVLGGVALFVALLLALSLGQRLGLRRVAAKGDGASGGGGAAMNGAVFGLLGLLIAFTFSGAAGRFEERRALIVEEANAIGTAYLRLDLLKPEARERLKQRFRGYLDTRLAAYGSPSFEGFVTRNKRALELQGEIWSDALPAAAEVGAPATQLLVPALNDMFDITTKRTAGFESHPPTIIYAILILLALVSAVLAGAEMPIHEPNWASRAAFAAAVSLTIVVTLDIEHPRFGLIRIDKADHILVEVRESMK